MNRLWSLERLDRWEAQFRSADQSVVTSPLNKSRKHTGTNVLCFWKRRISCFEAKLTECSKGTAVGLIDPIPDALWVPLLTDADPTEPGGPRAGGTWCLRPSSTSTMRRINQLPDLGEHRGHLHVDSEFSVRVDSRCEMLHPAQWLESQPPAFSTIGTMTMRGIAT